MLRDPEGRPVILTEADLGRNSSPPEKDQQRAAGQRGCGVRRDSGQELTVAEHGHRAQLEDKIREDGDDDYTPALIGREPSGVDQ